MAHAPVPHAPVKPAARSHTFRWISLPSMEATLTFARSGKTESCSMMGPSRARSIASTSSTKKTACGLPMLTAMGFSSSSHAKGIEALSMAKASGMACQSNLASPIATVTSLPDNLPEIRPPLVSISRSFFNSAMTQREALPHASTSPPSGLKMRIATSATSDGSNRINWSQPIPSFRSAIWRARAGDISIG